MSHIATKCQLRITGLTCADCAEKLAQRLQKLPSVSKASVNFAFAKVVVEHEGTCEAIEQEIKAAGYGIVPDKTISELVTSVFRITGMDCSECAAKIERVVSAADGVEQASVNFITARLTVSHHIPTVEIIRIVEGLGYSAIPEADSTSAEATGKHSYLATHARGFTTAISGFMLVLAWGLSLLNVNNLSATSFLAVHFDQVLFINYLLAVITGGFWTIRLGISSLKARIIDINVLMVVAVSGALIIREWNEAATVAFLFSVSNLLESYAMEKTRQSIRRLMELAPTDALILRNGQEIRLPVEEVQLAEVVLVKPGDKIPVDGCVSAGGSAVDQAAITGESVPVEKQIGDEVYAGTMNMLGALEIKVTKLANDSALARIIHLVEEAQAQRAPSQAFVDRFARYYTPAVLILAVGIAIIPPFFFHQAWDPWLYRALALLVVSCPCALVISTPVAIVSAIGNAARHGVLIKGGAFLEQAGSITAMAFDKTGTLTQGRPEVTDIIPFGNNDATDLLRVAAAVEQRATHPLADTIIRRAQQDQIALPAIEGFSSLPGQGAMAYVGNELFYVGAPKLFEMIGNDLTIYQADMQRLYSKGKSIILVGTKSAIYGMLAAADQVRPESAAAIADLRQAGIARMVMLTGDHDATARVLAESIGIDDYRADLMPEQKVSVVKELQAQYGAITMVGDGINDAPALATANIGIAMGAAGTDAALETADIVLMADDLSKISYLIRLSRKALRVIKENIALSLIIKGVALLLIFPGWLTLWMAVLADMGASILVTLNGLRLVNGVKKKS